MIVIEHRGDVVPGQKCSAIYFDEESVQSERAFYERFCRGNGMQDDVEIALLVDAHVPRRPYWLVSIKPPETRETEETRYHKVDDRSGEVLPDLLI